MDVLFINPSSGKQVYQALANKYSAISTPYWLLLIAESTRSAGYEVSILDLLAEKIQKDKAVERINKQRYSGFYGTDLGKKLEEIAPDKIIICGVCTDICVLHTAAEARNRDFKVEVFESTVASFNKEAHSWALDHMKNVLGVNVVSGI